MSNGLPRVHIQRVPHGPPIAVHDIGRGEHNPPVRVERAADSCLWLVYPPAGYNEAVFTVATFARHEPWPAAREYVGPCKAIADGVE